MRVSLLGPVLAWADGGTPIEIGGARLRMLLARLALDAGRVASTESLVDGLWGTEPPADAVNALQSLVSRLRRALGDGGRVTSANGGYLLEVGTADIDAHRFEELVASGRRDLTAGRHAAASATLTEALGLWRGEPLSDVLDAPFAQAPAARLADLKVAALEDRFEAELELGRHAEVIADLETAGADHPLRERLAGLRMRGLCAAGRQSDALGVYERTRALLADELGVDPSAELRQVHLAVLRGELAEPKTVTRHETLPARLTSFVGRARELGLIAESLVTARLVTLAGPGGAGKTRLATEAAARYPAHDRGRVWFVGLAAVRDPGDLTGAVLGALGSLDFSPVAKPMAQSTAPLDRITELLRGDEALLVLDNCEHLVGAAAELAHELLNRLPRLRILATSREPLAITGEVLCQLGPLEKPEAVQLFTERAATVRPGFTLDSATTDAVAEICQRLDGMPLALELAAARLRSMSVTQIAQRLDDRFRLLTSGSRTALPRQQTLRAVVEWSWDLLEKPERILARRLSIFPGGATVSAAEVICADELLSTEDVFYVLGSLVEKSIVDVVGNRYRMLETIRVYGEERLDEAGEREAVTRRFGNYFLNIAEENEPRLRGRDQLHAIAAFDAEHDNMVAALRRAIDRDEADTAYRYVQGMLWYWVIRGSESQAFEFFADIVRFEGRIPDYAFAAFNAMHSLFRALPASELEDGLLGQIEECVRTDAMTHYPPLALGLPMLSFLSRNVELAYREVQRAYAHPDPWARACAHWIEGYLLTDRGDLAGSQRAREAALRGFQELGDRWGIAMTLSMLAELRSVRGEHEKAIEGFTQGLELARELGSFDDMAQQLCRLANERVRAGDLEDARREIGEAQRIAEESRQPQVEAMVKFFAAEVARRAGDFAEAHRALDWLRARAPQLGLPGSMAIEWAALGTAAVAVCEGDTAKARQQLPMALEPAVRRNDMPDASSSAQIAAHLFRLEGRPDLAAWALGISECLRGVFDAGDPELRELVAELRAELGDQSYADTYRRGSSLPRQEAARLLIEALS